MRQMVDAFHLSTQRNFSHLELEVVFCLTFSPSAFCKTSPKLLRENLVNGHYMVEEK